MPKFSAANNMDPGAMPDNLPALTIMEEMMVAKLNMHMQIKRVRGVQYKYSGHTVCFIQNVRSVP